MILDKYCVSTKQATHIIEEVKSILDTQDKIVLSLSYNAVIAPPFVNALFALLLKAGYDIEKVTLSNSNDFKDGMFARCKEHTLRYHTDPEYAKAVAYAINKTLELFDTE